MSEHALDHTIPLRNADYFAFLHTQFASARRRIWVSMFTVNAIYRRDAALEVRTLLHDLAAAARRGVDVRLLTGADGDSLSELLVANRVGLGYLAVLGVPARYDCSTGKNASHTKCVLVDDECVVIGSHNWSPRSLSKGIDDSIALFSEGVAADVAVRFNRRWTRAREARFSSDLDLTRMRLDVRDPGPAKGADLPSPVAGGAATLLWGERYRRDLRARIAAATSSVAVIMFYASVNAAKHPTRDLIRALHAARGRGVDVKVIFDRGKIPGQRSLNKVNGRAAAELRRGGIAVEFETPERVTHSKVVIIDQRSTFVGSHNWTANSLLTSGDASVVIDSAAVAENFRRDFERRWAALAEVRAVGKRK